MIRPDYINLPVHYAALGNRRTRVNSIEFLAAQIWAIHRSMVEKADNFPAPWAILGPTEKHNIEADVARFLENRALPKTFELTAPVLAILDFYANL